MNSEIIILEEIKRLDEQLVGIEKQITHILFLVKKIRNPQTLHRLTSMLGIEIYPSIIDWCFFWKKKIAVI